MKSSAICTLKILVLFLLAPVSAFSADPGTEVGPGYQCAYAPTFTTATVNWGNATLTNGIGTETSGTGVSPRGKFTSAMVNANQVSVNNDSEPVILYTCGVQNGAAQWHYVSFNTYGNPVSTNFPAAIAAVDSCPKTGANRTCVLAPTNPCEDKQGQSGAPIYTGMPRDAQYYDTVGVCDGGCTVKPASGPIANNYANDGSGYVIGPWVYTGAQCQQGVTEDLPPQPPPEEQDDAGDKACAAGCAGRAYQYDPATGACECFGAAPSTEDPPLDPTTPTPDPGSPTVPGAQTPITNPGGDAQLGAQITNQGKQIAQGDAQLGQLGAINGKLGAIISNQGKQLGQGDKALDYARRQLGVQEDIRNKLGELTEGDTPSLPDQPELDGTIPDTKNWTEYDDAQAIGQEQGQKQIEIIEDAQTESPFSLTLNTSGADPCLRGPVLGTEIEICFNRPWMLTGYNIMQGILISIGYLQAFLMVNRTVTGGK